MVAFFGDYANKGLSLNFSPLVNPPKGDKPAGRGKFSQVLNFVAKFCSLNKVSLQNLDKIGMQIEIKNLPKSQIEMTVELAAEEFEPFVKKAVLSLSQSVKIEGFRPGKAPRNLVEQKIGSAAIYEEAAELAARKTYIDAVLERGLKIVGRPQIQVLKLAPKNPFSYKAVSAVLPPVNLPDYKKIVLKAKSEEKPVEVSEKKIQDAIEFLRKSRAKHAAVSREARIGDFAEIDFEARFGGAKIENGESKNHPLVIGDKEFIPGFEENLVGMKIGEEKSFSLRAPKDYAKKDLADKILEFKVKLNSVQERILPELGDDFAKGLGKFGGLEDLKKNIKEGLAMEKEEKEKERRRMDILTRVASETEMEIPEILVENEKEKMAHELSHDVARLGLDFETYLSQIKKSAEELKKGWQKDAEQRIKIALILREIAAKENIAPTKEEIERKSREIASRFHSPEEAEKIGQNELADYAEGLLRNEKVFEFFEKMS